MFALVWVAGVIAFYFSWRGRKALRDAGVTKGFRSIVATQLTEILGIYVAAGAVFLGIAMWVNATGAADPTLRTLWDCQSKLQWMAMAVGKLKVPGHIGTATLIALALAAWFYESEPAELLWKWLSRYQWAMKRMTLAATALASFTLFSGTVDEGKAKIDVAIRKASDHYAAYAAELEETATESATASAVRRASVSLPPEWKAVSSREAEIQTRAAELHRVIDSLAREHGVAIGPRQAAKPDANAERNEKAEAQEKPEAQPEAKAPPEAGAFNEGRLARLRANLKEARERMRTSTAEFLETQLGSKIPDALVGDLLSHSHWQALRVAGQENPLLEALLGIVDRAIAGEVAERLKQAVARLARDGGASDPASELAQAAESAAPVGWAEEAGVIARADRRSRAELGQLDTALQKCRDIEAQAIATEAAAFRAREEALIAKWSAIAGDSGNPRGMIDFGSLAAAAMGDEPHKPFAGYGSVVHRFATRRDHSDAAELFVASLEAPGISSDRRELAMREAEAVAAGAGSVEEKAAALGKLTFEPAMPSLTDGVWNGALFGGFGDEFTATYENARERDVRLQREKMERDWKIEDEERKIHEVERAQFKEEFGYDMDEIDGVRGVRGIRIGKWELPEIPLRALREIRIP